MFCPHCGKEIDDKAALCPHCGTVVDETALGRHPASAPVSLAPQNNSCAIAGFVLAFFFPFIGLILSIIGCKNSKACGGKGKGLSIAGIILSILMFAAQIILALYVIGGMVDCFNEIDSNINSCTIDCNLNGCEPSYHYSW